MGENPIIYHNFVGGPPSRLATPPYYGDEAERTSAMNALKTFLRWTVGILIGVYLVLLLAINIPSVQRLLAGGVARILASQLHTEVSIGRVQLGFNGRIIIDEVAVNDQSDEPLLTVRRLGTRLNLLELLNGRVRLGQAQLFGARAWLYQQMPDTPPNFQFIVDALSSNDTTSTFSLDLRIGQILVRRAYVSWDQRWKPETPGQLNTAHLSLANLNVTAELNALAQDTLNLRVKRFDVMEQYSGLRLKELALSAVYDHGDLSVTNLHLALPASTLDAPSLTCTLKDNTISNFSVDLSGTVSSHDIAPLSPFLAKVDDALTFSLQADGTPDDINISELRVSDTMMSADLSAQGNISNLSKGLTEAVFDVNVQQASADTRSLTQWISTPIVERLGDVRFSGPLRVEHDQLAADLRVSSSIGNVDIKGTAQRDGTILASLAADSLHVGSLLDNSQLGSVTLDAEASGNLNGTLNVSGTIDALEYKGYTYKNIGVSGNINGRSYEGSLSLHDQNVSLEGEGRVDLQRGTYALRAEVEDFAPDELHLTDRFPGTRFSGSLAMDVQGDFVHSLDGYVHINDFTMLMDQNAYRPGDVHLTARHEDDEQAYVLISPFLEAQLEGKFTLDKLIGNFRYMLSQHLSAFIPFTAKEVTSDEYCTFLARVYNMQPLKQFVGIDIDIDQPVVLEGAMDAEVAQLNFTTRIPHLIYGKEDLRDVSLRIEGDPASLLSTLQLKRLMKGSYVDLGMEATQVDNRLATHVYWDNDKLSSIKGDISLSAQVLTDADGRQRAVGEILPTPIVVGDNNWQVYPGSFTFSDGSLTLNNFSIGDEEHNLAINGRISREDTDTLHASLKQVSLDDIFSMINFNAVEFSGLATGDVYAHSLFSKPNVDARIQVPQFSLNDGNLGYLNLFGNWGQRDYSIYLDGTIIDTLASAHTTIRGYVTPKSDVPYHGLDLNIGADHTNIHFINKYTQAIFDNMQGRATGSAHLFGPFKQLNVEGDLLVNEGSLGIPLIGVRYHLQDDSLHLTPGNILFTAADLYDPQGRPGQAGHHATVDGHLTHNHFSNLRYDIDLHAENLLGYNFRDFGDLPFYGTVLASGDVGLSGSPGTVNINIKAQPQQGSFLTYDLTTPDNVEQTSFITYVDRSQLEDSTEVSTQTVDIVPTSDIRINFDLDLDSRATMNLLMDSRSGDMISVNGRGHMLARYYNKGGMQIFGTYRIERGTYNLSLQEIIHKNFDLLDGSYITFTGEPMNADLNIQASHTVSGVSLNDISARSTFSNTSARVNCLMDITGKASQPNIAFDFDILNVNEDEKQMVRSLISTEEERNMQVIYLLGIGRFYTYDYTNDSQSQSSTAMNSLLSSTLSGQINQMLSNMIGSSNWNFGTNLNTGTTGWSDLDVEGMLQGSLLNNRLLINGNFGYRDNPVNSSNFIGDFDAQYHLTRSGSMALKAYNKTNDRYFTKSSLTTQGVGLLLKKDFSNLHDLFTRKKRSQKD